MRLFFSSDDELDLLTLIHRGGVIETSKVDGWLHDLTKQSEHSKFIGKENAVTLINSVTRATLLAHKGEPFNKVIQVARGFDFETVLFREGYEWLTALNKACELSLPYKELSDKLEHLIRVPIQRVMLKYTNMVTPDGTLPIGPTRLERLSKSPDFPRSFVTENLTFIHNPTGNYFLYISHPKFESGQFGHVSLWVSGHWVIHHPFKQMADLGFNSIKPTFLQRKNKEGNSVSRSPHTLIFVSDYGTRRILATDSSVQIMDIGGKSEFIINPEFSDDIRLVGKVESKTVSIPSVLLPMRKIKLTGHLRSITVHV